MPGAERIRHSNAEPHPIDVLPYGRYGAGLYTGHPIGLLIILCLMLMGLIALPEVRWFFAASVVLGGICGLFLWLRHGAK
jgi:hypothetical protein